MPNIDDINDLLNLELNSPDAPDSSEALDAVSKKIHKTKARLYKHITTNKDLKHLFSPSEGREKLEEFSAAAYPKRVNSTAQRTKKLLSNLDIGNNFDEMANDFIIHQVKKPQSFDKSWKSFIAGYNITDSQARNVTHKLKNRIRGTIEKMGLSTPGSFDGSLEVRQLSSPISGGAAKTADSFVYNRDTKQFIIPTTTGFDTTKPSKLAMSLLHMHKDMNNISFVSPKGSKSITRIAQADRQRVGYREKESSLSTVSLGGTLDKNLEKTLNNLGNSFEGESPVLRNLPLLKNIGSPTEYRTANLGVSLSKFETDQAGMKLRYQNELRKIASELTSGMSPDEATAKLKATTVGDFKHISRLSSKDFKTSFEDYIIDDEVSVYKALPTREMADIKLDRRKGSRIRENSFMLAEINKLEKLTGRSLTDSMKEEIFNTRDNNRPTQDTFRTIHNMSQRAKDVKHSNSLGINHKGALRQAVKTFGQDSSSVKKLLNLYTMDNPAKAASFILKNGIPKGFEPFLQEGMTNLQGNTRKDFMQSILSKVVRAKRAEYEDSRRRVTTSPEQKLLNNIMGYGQNNKTKFKDMKLDKTFKTIGGMLDQDTFETLQKDLMFTGRLKHVSDSAYPTLFKRKYSRLLTSIGGSIEDGFTTANPQIAKTMENSFSSPSGVVTFQDELNKATEISSSSEYGLLGSKESLKNMADDAKYDKQRKKLEGYGLDSFEIEKEITHMKDSDTNSLGYQLTTNSGPEDSYLDSVLTGDAETKGIRKGELEKLLKKDTTRDKNGKLQSKTALERLISKVRSKEANTSEILKLVNLGKALGMTSSPGQDKLGTTFYKSLFSQLYDLQANYDYNKDWNTVSTSNQGTSGKFIAQAKIAEDYAKGQGTSNLGGLKGSSGRVRFNHWNGENYKDDWAWQKRNALVQALSRNKIGYASEMADFYTLENEQIKTQHPEQLKRLRGPQTELSKEASGKYTELKSLTKEEYIQANKVESLIRAHGGIANVPFDDIDSLQLGKSLFENRHPEDYIVPTNPGLIDKDTYKTKKYKGSYLRKIEYEQQANSARGKKEQLKAATESLGLEGMSDRDQMGRFVTKYSRVMQKLQAIGPSMGVDRVQIPIMAKAIASMAKDLHKDPIQQAAALRVIDQVNSYTQRLTDGKEAKTLKRVWKDPKKTIANMYRKALRQNTKETFKGMTPYLDSNLEYSTNEIRQISSAFNHGLNERLAKTGLGEYHTKSKANHVLGESYSEELNERIGQINIEDKYKKRAVRGKMVSMEELINSEETSALRPGREGVNKKAGTLSDETLAKHKTQASSNTKLDPTVVTNTDELFKERKTREDRNKLDKINLEKEKRLKKRESFNDYFKANYQPEATKETLDRAYAKFNSLVTETKASKNTRLEAIKLSNVKEELKDVSKQTAFKRKQQFLRTLLDDEDNLIYNNWHRVLPQAKYKSLKGKIPFRSRGVLKFAKGGFIPGKSTKDEVPALLMKGESVLNQKTTKSLGITDKASFDRFQSAAAEGKFSKYETGGLVTGWKDWTEQVKKDKSKYTFRPLDLDPNDMLNDVTKLMDNYLSESEKKEDLIASQKKKNGDKGKTTENKSKADAKQNINETLEQAGREQISSYSEIVGEGDIKGHLRGKRLIDPKNISTHSDRRQSVSNINQSAMFMTAGTKQQKELFKLQKDLIVSAFEENNPAKAVIEEVFNSGIAGETVKQTTVDKYNKLSGTEKNAVSNQLGSSIATQELSKVFKPLKDLSKEINALNENLEPVRKLTGLNEKEFTKKYGTKLSLDKKQIASLSADIGKAKTYQTKGAGETTQVLGALGHIQSIDQELNNSQQSKDKLNATRDVYSGKKNLQAQAANRVDNFKEQMMNNAVFMGSYAALGAGTALITGTLGSAVEFQDRLKNLQAITGSSSTEMGLLTDSVKKVAVTTKFSASEISDAATILGQAGYTANSISGSLGGVVKLATATGSSLEDSTQTITSALTIWDKSFSESEVVANQFTAAVNKSKLDINSLGLALQYSGNIAAQGNIPVEDVLTLTSLMKDAGIKRGSTLGTGQRMLFSDIIAPSAKFAKSLKAANISLKDFNKVFNDEGVIGVFKFMKDSGYTFQHATRGMEVRERTAYAAISNQIDKADAFRSSIIGTSAAEDANEIQLSSTKNRFKNMINSWSIGFYSQLESSLDGSGDLFKQLTLEGDVKKKPMYAKSKEDYLESFRPPEGETSGLMLGLTAAGIYGANYLSKGSLSTGVGLAGITAGDKMAKMAPGLTKSLGEAVGKLTPSIKTFTGFVGKWTSKIPKLPALAVLTTAAQSWSLGKKAYEETENEDVESSVFWASMLKAAPSIIGGVLAGAGATMAGATGLGIPVAAVLGSLSAGMISEGLGVNDSIDRSVALSAEKDAGFNSQQVFEHMATTAEAYSELQSNLGKTYAGISKDKALVLKKTKNTTDLSGEELKSVLAENSEIEAGNAQKNLISRKKALEMEKQYSSEIADLNNYLDENFSFIKGLDLAGNNQKQLLKNIQEFKELSAKANTTSVKDNFLSGLKLYSVAKQEEVDKVTNKASVESILLTGALPKAIAKIVRLNPIAATENKQNFDQAISDKAISFNNKTKDKDKLSDKELKSVITNMQKSYKHLANVAVLATNDLEILGQVQKDIASNGKESVFYANRKEISERTDTVLADKGGYTKLLSDKGELENLADKLGKVMQVPLKQMDSQIRSTFTSLNRSLGGDLSEFANKLAADTFTNDQSFSKSIGDTFASVLDDRLGGDKQYRKLLSQADPDKLHKQVLSNEDPEAVKTAGGVTMLKPMEELATKLGKMDIAKLTAISDFVDNLSLERDITKAKDLKNYRFAEGLNRTLRNANIAKDSFKTVSSMSTSDIVNMTDRSGLANNMSEDYRNRQTLTKQIAIKNLDIRTANIKEAKIRQVAFQQQELNISARNKREDAVRQYRFNLDKLNLNTDRSRRDVTINRVSSERNLRRDVGFSGQKIGRSKEYSVEDLGISKERKVEANNRNYNRNIQALDRSVQNQQASALLNYARSLKQVGINFRRSVADLKTSTNQARHDARKNYARQVNDLNRNYGRTLAAINRAIADTNTLFSRNLQKPVVLTVNADTLLGLADKMSNISLAMDANKAKLSENTSAIKQWININKTKEDLVKEAYKEAYKVAGGDVNSEIFNKTYLDYMDKNSDKLIDVIVDQGVTKAQAGFSFDATRALTDPEYMKEMVAAPETAPTAASAATGNSVSIEQLVDLLYGAANGAYRTTTTVGDVTGAKGEMGAALFDLQTAMLKYDLSIRDAGIKLAYDLQDAHRKYSRDLSDIATQFNRNMTKLSLDFQRALEDLSIKLAESMQDIQINKDIKTEELGIGKSFGLEDIARGFEQGIEDINRNTARQLEELGISFSENMTKIADSVRDSFRQIAIHAADAKADLARALSFNLEGMEINSDRLSAALGRQLTEMLNTLAIDVEQSKEALEQSQIDAVALATFDAIAMANKYEESFRDSMKVATFDAVILQQKIEDSIQTTLQKVDVNTENINDKMQSVFQNLFNNEMLQKVANDLGATTAEQLIAGLEKGTIKLKDIKENLVKRLSKTSDETSKAVVDLVDKTGEKTTQAIKNKNFYKPMAAELTKQADWLTRSLKTSTLSINRGFSSVGRDVTKGANEAARTMTRSVSQAMASLNRDLARARAASARAARTIAASSNIAGHSSSVGMSTGGVLPGYGGGDRRPTLLEDGEAVVRKETVRALGADYFNGLNKSTMSIPKVNINTISSSNNQVSQDSGNNFNITIPVAPDASLASIERNLPMIANGVKKVFEEYL